MRKLNEAAQAELDRLREESGGLLLPSAVVARARDESSPLHQFFDWDDTEAARLWRLEQARSVIRMCVTVVKQETPPVRLFVSLTTDRKNDGGGYRSIYDVLDDDAMRRQMELDALADLRTFRRKYENLKVLGPLWDAMGAIESQLTQKVDQPTA